MRVFGCLIWVCCVTLCSLRDFLPPWASLLWVSFCFGFARITDYILFSGGFQLAVLGSGFTGLDIYFPGCLCFLGF